MPGSGTANTSPKAGTPNEIDDDAATQLAASATRGLGSLALLDGVTDKTLTALAMAAQTKTLTRGALLFSVGDASDALYVVRSGRVRIWTVSAAGSEITLNIVTSGDVFGEIGMLDGGARTACASAMTDCAMAALPRRPFFAAMADDPRLTHNVIALLCGRLRWVIARMEDAALCSAPQRLARILVYLVQDHGRATDQGIEVTIELTQGELAQWAAMSRESLNKTIARWTADGMLSQIRGRLNVRELPRLEAIATGEL